jgi:predicted CoA-binding protein
MTIREQIEVFFNGAPYAVVGASRDRAKYGNMVLRSFLQAGRRVFPVNPNAEEVEGLRAYPELAALPEAVHGVCVITQPEVTGSIIEQAGRLGVKHVWLQPGAESQQAIQIAREFDMNLIYGGPCVLVTLGFWQDDPHP